ncbi:diguanylate cyclase [Granulicella cerasi]|uniref:diguanylate cyclase n=1 Tax=Granulicella cerasi TaxID=741063 RepID=A0ABW1Z9Q9_9BACT|nr:GGDEF domain-containing protein [Granulicella cerasi]
MSIDVLLFIQDVQLVCFCVLFGFIAAQHDFEPVRLWLWCAFIATAIGAMLAFLESSLPFWLSHTVHFEMLPLSIALINVSLVYFVRRWRWTIYTSFALLLASLPVQILWRTRPGHMAGFSVEDLVLGLQAILAGALLLNSSEESTRLSRRVLSFLFFCFSAVELTRSVAVFVLHLDPDKLNALHLATGIIFVVFGCMLPLTLVWMLGSRSEALLTMESLIDPLTQVMNRRGLRQVLEREVRRLHTTRGALSVAVLDLDYFKQLNDRYGHVTGDAMLAGIARQLRCTLRDSDHIARFGGEEFVLLMPHTDADTALALLEQVRRMIEAHHELSPGAEIVRTTASIGVTTTRDNHTATSAALLHEADRALYQAKETGRNIVRVFEAEAS